MSDSVSAGVSQDTYDHAREAAVEQIVRDQKVCTVDDAIEADVLGLWSEFIEIPYGNFILRINADISMQKHDELMRFIAGFGEAGLDDNIHMLTILTAGLYKNDIRVYETDEAFWSNTANWSNLKARQIVSAYIKNYKEEIESTTSFLDAETSEGSADSQGGLTE